MLVSIIDYGLGNIKSVLNMLNYIGVPANIINKPHELNDATHIILPGVGSFDTGMKNLKNGGWLAPLNEQVLITKKPVLGICLGMQIMTEGSDEGILDGLGWFAGRCKKFVPTNDKHFRIPRMGWEYVQEQKDSSILKEMDSLKFFFAHSFYFEPKIKEDVMCTVTYERDFCAGIKHENIIGVQFHPEKSHTFGMRFFKQLYNITQ